MRIFIYDKCNKGVRTRSFLRMDCMELTRDIERLCGMIAQALEGNYQAADIPCGVGAELEPLYLRIRQIVEAYRRCDFEMQSAASQILSATEDLSLTLEESAEFSRELYGRSRSLRDINAKSHASTTAATGQIREFIERVDSFRQAADTAKLTNAQTRAAIDSALGRVQQTVGFIGEIEGMTAETVDYVRAFIASTARISEILRIVESLSKQMELISFNALIESRRAGLEGRSFGVIASAFRDLTEESKREVAGVHEVVATLHGESKKLEETVARNAAGVQACAAHTSGITAELGAVESNYREVSDVIDAIYRDVEAQSRTAQDISRSVQDIEGSSAQTGEDFEGIHRAIKKQKAEMDDLSRLGSYLREASQRLSAYAERAGKQTHARDVQADAQAADAVFTMLNAVMDNPAFYAMEEEAHRRMLDRLMEAGVIESVWSNHANGKFVYSKPPAGIANARIRPWFRESAAGRNYVSDVYISAITRQPCVTVSVPIVRDGQCIGVLGADLKL